jgi:hypothetical protein
MVMKQMPLAVPVFLTRIRPATFTGIHLFAVVTMRLTEREACRVALSIEQPECQINNYQIALIDSKSNAKLSSGF